MHYINHSLYNSGSVDYGIEFYIENQKTWAISHTLNIGKANVNNFRFGYLDAYAPESSQTPPSSLAGQLAETGIFTKFAQYQETWPSIGLTSFYQRRRPGELLQRLRLAGVGVADSFTQVRGKHTFGLGLDYRDYSLIRNLDDDFYGDWGFGAATVRSNSELEADGKTSSCPNTPVVVAGSSNTNAQALCGTGNAVADMMHGLLSAMWAASSPAP